MVLNNIPSNRNAIDWVIYKEQTVTFSTGSKLWFICENFVLSLTLFTPVSLTNHYLSNKKRPKFISTGSACFENDLPLTNVATETEH